MTHWFEIPRITVTDVLSRIRSTFTLGKHVNPLASISRHITSVEIDKLVSLFTVLHLPFSFTLPVKVWGGGGGVKKPDSAGRLCC